MKYTFIEMIHSLSISAPKKKCWFPIYHPYKKKQIDVKKIVNTITWTILKNAETCEQISGGADMPNFTSKEYFKTHFLKTIFQKKSLILFVLAGTTQDLESLEDKSRS